MKNYAARIKKLEISALLLLLLAGIGKLRAQDPMFSQFYATPAVLNPAFAGTTNAPRFSAAFRNQWPTVTAEGSAAYSTYAASWDQFSEGLNSGFGLLLLSDNAGGGMLKTNAVTANYAYRIAVSEDLNIRLGINAGFRQSQLDWDKLVFFDQLDPLTGPTGTTNELRPEVLTRTVFDVGAGLLAYGEKFYGGISLNHLTTPQEGFLQRTNPVLVDGLPLRVSLHGGAQFIVRPGNKRRPASFVSPNAMFVQQGGQGQFNVGAYYNHGLVFVGSWYRHAFSNPDAVIVLMGFQYDIMKIGYSYDYTVSGLSPSGGSHEISLVFNLDNSEKLKQKRFSGRYNDCFKIFR
ncbi:MAG: hypothetical protein RI973_638 [Bacteroidota bacterium]|jgi:type IX secretion system PorP/SprF family membrane protein